MSSFKESRNDNYEIGTIRGVQFGVYSPEEILRRSVVSITVDTFYDSNGDPRINGLFDPRMGYIEPHLKCKTCEQTYIYCPGHFGHIELPKPVFNLQPTFEEYIVKILKCVCIKCSHLLINKNHQLIKNIMASTKGNYKDRFEKIFKLTSKVKVCGSVEKNDTITDNGGCGAIQPSKYNKTNLRTDNIIVAEWKYESGDNPVNLSEELNADIILAIFKRITEDDALVMGFSSKWCMPHWLIISVLPVVPPSVRPSVRQYNSQRSEDDLTNKYYDIIKACQFLRDKLAKGINLEPEKIKQYVDLVQHEVVTLFNNDIKGIPNAMTRGGRPMKTLHQRLSGKEGRIRNNLMGKRVDFSARSVISPDANLSIEELGVPEKIAMNLTFPEVVNKYNINKMYQLVRNGNKVYPGAKSWKSVNDGKQKLIIDGSKIVLEYGDVVNRQLVDGDIVLFNRQPSLHKMSMMAHPIRVMKGNTFRLNVDVCTPYAADFDGDEMNMHVPQSLQTSVELKYLAAVSKHIITPSTGSPIISPAQDNLLGLFKLTDDNVFFTHAELMNILVGVKKFNGIIPEPKINDGKIVRWTGKQIYSLILPPITMTNKISETSETYSQLKDVIIEDGILKQGQVEKKTSSKIVHIIFNDYGHREAARYLNDLQTIATRYMIRSGFSLGISDLIVNPEIRKRNEDFILNGKKEIIELTKKVHLNIMEDITEGLDILYEQKVKKINQDVARAIMSNTTKSLPLNNRMNYIVTSGSKGSSLNIQQMMCLVGQQDIDNARVPLGFTDRTLPHYPRYENGGESRGFISSNFLNGLNPQEFFFHAMSGREGVIDKAVKTANSGYMQRRLVKAMEDLKVSHDMTVRGSTNDIVQFCYGYDGFNSTALESQKTAFAGIDIEKLNINYYIDFVNDKFDYVSKNEIDKMKKIDGWKDIISKYNAHIVEITDLYHKLYPRFLKIGEKINDISLRYPVNFNRLIVNTINQFKLANAGKSDINPVEIIREIDELVKYCRINNMRNITFELLVYDFLAPKILLRDKKFNRVAFLHIINFIKARFKHSLAEGGEMVGPLAAQSLGEKTTQMTMKTFQSAGVGEKSAVTSGVTRLNELLSNTKNLKNSNCLIFLKEDHRFNHEMAEKMRNNIELATIGDILASTAIYLEPNNDYANVLEDDREFMEIYKVFSDIDPQATQIPNNPWVIRLEFDRRKIIDKKITMEDIYIILKHNYSTASLMFMDDNAAKLVFRLRMPFQTNAARANDDITYLEAKIKEISDIIIKGIDGITRVFIQNDSEAVIKENGSFISKKEYYLDTEGSNLFEALIRKGVDPYRTLCIDPNEMYSVFGIEVARFIIQNQLTMLLLEFDINLSPRHLDLLCDKMCQNGDIMSINRHGIKKENIGPLAKASFEETTDQLLEASLFGAYDNIKGVSSNIMVGQIPTCGTGDSTVLIDEDLLPTPDTITQDDADDYEHNKDEDINKIFESSEYCENADIKFSLGDINANRDDYDYFPEIDVS